MACMTGLLNSLNEYGADPGTSKMGTLGHTKQIVVPSRGGGTTPNYVPVKGGASSSYNFSNDTHMNYFHVIVTCEYNDFYSISLY